ncbi:hypothetical protein COCSADRAFT_190936 [Bipolaris sorokiniana ND90Pr]|uniref:Cytochrome P450 n=1 Tax=Cochliobolus sativus (strain ND90Pr / ATCC 201652) TaxID=665912 RepID=M2SN58_COCSN|nr:uncharacterized protein COCSADRAFT_190936 [Bipolaris sorokiniana ND90Pr]EMD63750.1 hypothetical protein COCSADRAFT_190936 [Bipolaris sorokiniana ND90Pr]
MLLTLIVGFIGAVLLYLGPKLRRFSNNYQAARATGLPMILCPYNPDSGIWAFLCVPLRPVLLRILPTALFATVELSIWCWEFRDKYAIHERLGPAFVYVTMGNNRLICADPAMASDILSNRKDYSHPDITVTSMGVLGANIMTAKSDSWSRHRRIVAPALNERISPHVWTEAAEQASSLADVLLSSKATTPAQESVNTLHNLHKVALNVLVRIAYGRRQPFSVSPPPSSTDSSAQTRYVDAIVTVVELLAAAAFIPRSWLALPFMPQALKRLGAAMNEMPDLVKNVLDRERQENLLAQSNATDATENPKDSSTTIMTTLVRISDQEKEQNKTSASSKTSTTYLTEEEIAGNLFVFTAAGYETTANTMSYAATLLAVYPEWQTWMQAEIDAVFETCSPSQSDYSTVYPKLVRCLAVMFEAARHFPPVSLVLRDAATSQTLKLGDRTFSLAGPFGAYVNTMALHTLPSIWGPDSLEFKPSRWLDPNAPEPVLITPPHGTYIPWSIGPRSCPGMKMSQVEFVSVMATLFRRCNARPVRKEGESEEQARQRLMDLMQDSQNVLTLRMTRQDEVGIEWVERKAS